MKKENVAVKVTAKNIGKLRDVFAMFPKEAVIEPLSERLKKVEIHGGYPYIIYSSGKWRGVRDYTYYSANTLLVKPKQLRAILAKEHLRAGDWVVCENKAIGVTKIVEASRFDNEWIYAEEWAEIGSNPTKKGIAQWLFKFFKRYATLEEIPVADNTKEVDKLSVGDEFELGSRTYKVVTVNTSLPPIKVEDVDPVDKWCYFWDNDGQGKTIRKYLRHTENTTYPHKDICNAVWKHYELLPEKLQILLNEL